MRGKPGHTGTSLINSAMSPQKPDGVIEHIDIWVESYISRETEECGSLAQTDKSHGEQRGRVFV